MPSVAFIGFNGTQTSESTSESPSRTTLDTGIQFYQNTISFLSILLKSKADKVAYWCSTVVRLKPTLEAHFCHSVWLNEKHGLTVVLREEKRHSYEHTHIFPDAPGFLLENIQSHTCFLNLKASTTLLSIHPPLFHICFVLLRVAGCWNLSNLSQQQGTCWAGHQSITRLVHTQSFKVMKKDTCLYGSSLYMAAIAQWMKQVIWLFWGLFITVAFRVIVKDDLCCSYRGTWKSEACLPVKKKEPRASHMVEAGA